MKQTAHAMSEGPVLRLLGGFALSVPDVDAPDLRNRKAQALLCYLALSQGRPRSRSHLTELLWPDRLPEQARHSLRQAMLLVRQSTRLEARALFDASSENIALVAGSLEVDAVVLQRLMDAGALEEAADRYSGALLEGFGPVSEPFDGWLDGARDRLRSRICDVRMKLGRRDFEAGLFQQAVEHYSAALALDPLREDALRALMRAHQSAGHRADALRQYRQFSASLKREYDAIPEKETEHLFRQILGRESGEAAANPRAPGLSALQVPDKPGIAVMPFENLSGDASQGYFADGISENVITALGRFRWFFVISRNTAFSYRSADTDVGHVADELGIRYILQGSVQRSERAVRINVFLTDTQTGHLIWTDRYDRELGDLFAVQDEITQAVISAVFPKFLASEVAHAQRKDPMSMESWDFLMRGRWHLWRFSRDDNLECQRLLQQAIVLDPNNAQAPADLAGTHVIEGLFGWASSVPNSLARAFDQASKAVALDDQDAWTQAILGLVEVFRSRHDEGIRRLELAIELNPNFALAHGFLGLALACSGSVQRGREAVHTAIRLSPRDPFMVVWYAAFAAAAFVAEQYEEAAGWARRSIEWRPDFPSGHRLLAASCGLLGQVREAQAAVADIRRLIPGQTLSTLQIQLPYRDPAVVSRFLEGLRIGGLPG